MKCKSAIGILGGMGPEASGYMYKILIDLSIKYFKAKNNDDFPEIVLYSVPVPDFISNDKEKHKALKMLKEKVRALNRLNILCLSLACNTAHMLLADLQSVSAIPFVSMIDEVVSVVKKDKKKTIGILGTPMTLQIGFYQDRLAEHGIVSVMPHESDYTTIERIIRNVISGKVTRQDKKLLLEMADELRERGAEGIILGCTELPLVFPSKYKIPVYNSVEILSLSLLRRYYQ